MIPILSGNVASALPSGYEVANSCRFNSADSAQLSKSVGSSATTKYTLSLWVKRGLITNGTGTGQRFFTSTGGSGLGDTYFRFNQDDTIEISGHGSSASTGGYVITNRLFRDPTAWMHIVIRYDSTESSANDRFRLYINGVDERTVGGYSTSTMPNSSVADNITASGNTIRIGATASAQYFNGYLTEIHFSEGQSYAPTEFGEYDEDSPTIWKPKKADISYGTSGFHLDFEDSSNMGNDANGGTDFTETNIDATDQATDTCTNNFATINLLYYTTSQSTLSDGNLTATSSGANWNNFHSTIAPSTGKWYWEVKVVNVGSNTHPIGIVGTDDSELNKTSLGDAFDNGATGISYVQTGDKDVAGSRTSYGDSYTTNDIIGVAMDLDNHKLYFSKNGTFQNSGNPASGATGTGAISIVSGHSYLASFAHYNTMVDSINFGSPSFAISSGNADGNGYGNFEYSVPSGYLSLCTKNLGSDGG